MGRDKEYTWVLKVAPAEIKFDQVKITHKMTGVFLDFCKDLVRMKGNK